MRSKRDHIITSSLRLYRTRGVCGTTLKDVSQVSGVPLGNLYYYFRTREELVLAVLDECERELQGLLDQLAPLPAKAWLEGYFEWLLLDPDAATHDGCPFGALALELRAVGDLAAPRAAEIVRTYRNAVRTHSSGPGVPAELADEVFLAVQGTYAVARVLNDPELYRTQMMGLRRRALGSLSE